MLKTLQSIILVGIVASVISGVVTVLYVTILGQVMGANVTSLDSDGPTWPVVVVVTSTVSTVCFIAVLLVLVQIEKRWNV